MDMTFRMITLRGVSMILLSGIACILGMFASPVGHAYASTCSKNNASHGLVSESLVCVSQTTILNTLGLKSNNNNQPWNVTICHIPPGNPSAEHTITVDESAVPAHMAHGDSMGPCPGWVEPSFISSLPTCAALVAPGSPAVAGNWVPSSAIGDGVALNAYLTQLQNGVVFKHADSANHSYREVYGR